MRFLTRLTLFDFVLLLAFAVAGVAWIATRGDQPAPSTGQFAQEATARSRAAATATVDQGIDAAVAAIIAGDGRGFIEGLRTVAAAARRDGHSEGAAAITALADAVATGDQRAYDIAEARIAELADDPIVSQLNQRLEAALISSFMAFPDANAGPGVEWAEILLIPDNDEELAPPALGIVRWSVEGSGTARAIVASVSIPDERFTGRVSIAPATASSFSVTAVADFDGPMTSTPINRLFGLSVGTGDLAFDRPLEADIRIDGWRIEAGVWSSEPASLEALRNADTMAWTGTTADGGRFIIRIVKGATGQAMFDEAFAAWRL